MSEEAGPLAGVRIIDLTSVLSGPAAMGLLADQGADVIKIEPPSGDIMRGRGTLATGRPDALSGSASGTGSGPVREAGGDAGTGEARGSSGGMSPGFLSCNRGKRSVVLDLKQRAAGTILWRLLGGADVLAQNFRPGVIERLGFGADRVRARFPNLVYLSISGVGERGPLAGRRVYDPVIQALSGLADIQADPVTGRPRMVRTLIADKTTAVYAAQAVTAALLARSRSGEGQHVRLSMLDTMVSFLWPEGMAPFTRVDEDTREARATPHDMIFPTADGYITLGAVSDREWRALCEAFGRPEWIEDPRFATGSARSANRQERLESVEAALAGFTSAEILARLEAHDVPSGPVLPRRAVLDHPQVVTNGIVSEIDQPGLGRARQPRPAARFEATPSPSPRPAPTLGQHTREVLEEAGYTAAEIEDLRAEGAFGA